MLFSMLNEDEKLFVKLDWNINDSYCFVLIYNYNDGNNFVEFDGDFDEFELFSYLYECGVELELFVGVFYFDWIDKFLIEICILCIKLDNF